MVHLWDLWEGAHWVILFAVVPVQVQDLMDILHGESHLLLRGQGIEDEIVHSYIPFFFVGVSSISVKGC